jgi:hypothetical protein
MRETRTSGSVEGVLSNGHPYSDCGRNDDFFKGIVNRTECTTSQIARLDACAALYSVTSATCV